MATIAIIGISPKMVTVESSQPDVLALKIKLKAIGNRTAVRSRTMNTPITFSSIDKLYHSYQYLITITLIYKLCL